MERRRQKNRNRRLMLALLMLLVSGIALTTATYAWFSANTIVKTEDIDVKVTASSGIAISANAVDFGKSINMSEVIAFGKEVSDGTIAELAADSSVKPSLQVPEELNPVSTVGLQANSWKFYKGQLGDEDSVTALTYSQPSTNWVAGKDFTYGDYVAFDVYIRSSVEQDIKFNESSTKIDVYDHDSTKYDDAKMQSALRIGVQNMGVYESSKNQQLNCYKLNSPSATEWAIYNPFPGMHHASSLTSSYNGTSEKVAGYYAAADGSDNLGTSTETYNGLGELDPAGKFVKYLYKDVKALKDADENSAAYFKLMNTDTFSGNYLAAETDGIAPANKIFTLKPGITKVRVYIWLEGQDIDCVDAISISDGLTISLGFEVIQKGA